MEISEFYAARLDEDEVAAKGAHCGPWLAREATTAECDELGIFTADGGKVVDSGYEGGGVWWQPDAAHIARHDPARVLRKVEAGRRILTRYEDCLARMEDPDYPAGVARDQAREYEDFVLPNLAAEFSDHPDYQESWKP